MDGILLAVGKSPNPGPLAERSWPGSPLDADALSDPAFSLVGGAEAPELEVDDDGLVVDDEAGLLVDAVPALLALVEAEDEDGLELEFGMDGGVGVDGAVGLLAEGQPNNNNALITIANITILLMTACKALKKAVSGA